MAATTDGDGSRIAGQPPEVLPYALGAIGLLALLAVLALVVRACNGDESGTVDDFELVDGVPADFAPARYAFAETWAGPLPRLRDGVEIVEWTAQVDGKRKPERYTLRVDGADLTPTSRADVVPLTRPVTTPEEATAQADLFRALRLAPGFGFASQTGGSPGLSPSTFDEWARAKGVKPDAIADAAADGWRIVRPVAEFTEKGPRIIVLRELVRPDGSYEATPAGVLADEDEVRAHRLVVWDL